MVPGKLRLEGLKLHIEVPMLKSRPIERRPSRIIGRSLTPVWPGGRDHHAGGAWPPVDASVESARDIGTRRALTFRERKRGVGGVPTAIVNQRMQGAGGAVEF